jgi:hypothetical protein
MAACRDFWSHQKHMRIAAHDQIISYTSQDIPADPINLRVSGSIGHEVDGERDAVGRILVGGRWS